MDKQLRLCAAQIVFESELSDAAKLQLLNFIQIEATDAQVKALILDGRIVNLDEQAEEIVNDRFDLLEFDPLTVYAGMLAAMTAMFGAAIAANIYNVYKTYMSKAGRACAGRSGEDRQRCIGDYKVKAKIAAYTSALSKCSKAKDPNKCQIKFKKKIEKLKGTFSK